MADELVPGRVEAKVRQDLDALITEHPMGESLTEMALHLARRMDATGDDAVDAKALAGVNRELRLTLLDLAGMAVEAGDELGADLSEPE